MHKSAIAVLGTSCLFIGLFLRYTMTSNLKLKKEIEDLRREILWIKNELNRRQIYGTQLGQVSGQIPVPGSGPGNINGFGVGNAGGYIPPIGQTSS